MKRICILCLFLGSTCGGFFRISALAHEEHEHREHGTHQHGVADLSLAFDGLQGEIEFKTPSEAIVGFEHTAKSAKDVQTRDAALKRFADKVPEMVVFEPSRACQFSKQKLEMVADSDKHSNIEGQFKINCKKNPEGSSLVFYFQKFFPRLKEVKVQALVGTAQKSATIKSAGSKLDLK